ncbi:MAG: sugar-binding domain-containing protein, partial [Pseudomonadota bacterium]
MARKLLSDWSCRVGFDETWLTNKLDGEHVFVPHNAVDLPWNYGDERAYQRQFTYQTRVDRQPERDEGVFALFEGAMANAHVWINGKLVAEHKDGYTPFEADLTTHLQTGSDNLLTVRVDGTENPSIPPFGGRIDYLTYAGIYRDVWLETRPQTWIDNVKVSFADPLSPAPVPHLDVFLSGIEDSREGRLRRPSIRVTIEDPQGSILQDTEISDLSAALPAIIDPKLWSPDEPNLYRVMVSLSNGHSLSCNFGIRRAEFRPEGFFLNGDRLQIVGLNRHQSFPHVGYALGPQAQETDADILKFELGLNLVRTSHYPQSTAFLDRCDEIGLMVFEEIPG